MSWCCELFTRILWWKHLLNNMCVYLLIAFCFIERPNMRKTFSNGLYSDKWMPQTDPIWSKSIWTDFFTGLFLPIHKDGVLLHIVMLCVHNIVTHIVIHFVRHKIVNNLVYTFSSKRWQPSVVAWTWWQYGGDNRNHKSWSEQSKWS